MITVDLEDLSRYESVLSDPAADIADRVDSLFCMKAFNQVDAVDALVRCFHKEPKSELLKHEICYCLGQMNKTEAHVARIQKFLEHVVDETNNYPEIVVHEAVEALGNMNQEHSLNLLKRFEDENKTTSILYETCFLARELIHWNQTTNQGKSEKVDFSQLKFKTNDPAPPFNIYNEPKPEHLDVAHLTKVLLNKTGDGQNYNLFERYRALFTLREINTKESLIGICQTLLKEHMDTCSALLKHEVAYVLAQMEEINEHSVQYLLGSVLNDDEAPIVRHEALIAVGEMIEDRAMLEDLTKHPEEIVRESAQVAVRNMDNRLKEWQYWKEKEH